MKEKMFKALPEVSEKASYRFVSAEEAGVKRVKKAAKKLGNKCNPDDVVAILDTSIFRTCKEGFVLTTQTLSGSFFKEVIRHTELISAECSEDNELVLQYKDGREEKIWGNIYANYLVEVLKKVISVTNAI